MNRQKVIFNFVSVLLLMGVTLYDIKNLDMITVLNDEFGYWSNAAIMAGIDWKPLVAETPYYSLGYSLLLVPLFWIFKDYAIMYKAAIVLNGLLLVASYFCAEYIVQNLLKIKSEVTKFCISILSVLSGTAIFHSHVGWAETLITFLMWVSIALLISIEKKANIGKVLSLSGLCIYMIAVHQRMLVCAAICMGCLGLILISKKWSWKQIAFVLIALGIGYIAYKLIKTIQLSQFYGNSSASDINNVTVSSNFFLKYWNRIKDEFVMYFISLSGKIAACLFMSYFTFPIAIYQYVCDALSYIKTKVKTEYFWTHTYIIFSLLAMVMVTSLQVINCFSRKDIVVYTRYFDYVVGPATMLGIYALWSMGKKGIRLFAGIYLVYGIFLYQAFEVITKAEGTFNVPCSPIYGSIMQYIKQVTEKVDWELSKVLAMWAGLAVFLCVLLMQLIKKRERRYICLTCVLLIGQIYIGHYSGEWLNNARDGFRSKTQPIFELIRDDRHSVYYIKNPEKVAVYAYYANPKYLQFMLRDKTINVITWEEEAKIDTDSWVLAEKSDEIDNTAYKLVKTTDKMYLYQKVGK